MEIQLEKIVKDSSISNEEKLAALDTLTKIFLNAIKYPDVEKYRQLKLGNKSFSQHVWRHSAAQEFLALAGWVKQDDKIVLTSNVKLQEARTQLTKAHIVMEMNSPNPVNIRGQYVSNEEIIKTLKLEKHEGKALEKYRLLLPKELEDWYMWFYLCYTISLDQKDMNYIAEYAQNIAKHYRKALKIMEQRRSLQLGQKQATDSELPAIQNKLAELEVEEHQLVCTCEDKVICSLQRVLFDYDNEEYYQHPDVKPCRDSIQAELQQRLQKKANRPLPSIQSPPALDFSAYESSLPATAQSYLQKQIDCDHEGVDIHLNKIAYYMKDWEIKLSALLGLTDIDIHDLKSMHPTPVLLRRSVLKTWQVKEGFHATYGKLLKLCCNGGDARTAKIICDILKEKAEEIDESEEKSALQEEAKPVDPLSKKPRLLPLCKEMAVLSEQWENVGLFLDLSQQDLDEVESEHSSTPSQCMTAMLKKWLLREDPPPTWEAVVEVVKFLQHEDVADALKQAAADKH